MDVKFSASRTDCAKVLAKEWNISEAEAHRRFDTVLDTLANFLKDKNCEGLNFVGVFSIKKTVRKAKIGRNPKDPEKTYDIPEKIVLKAKASANLDAEINAAPQKKKASAPAAKKEKMKTKNAKPEATAKTSKKVATAPAKTAKAVKGNAALPAKNTAKKKIGLK